MFADWRWNGVLLILLILGGLLALLIGWALSAAQKSMDRRWDRDEQAYREAMKRWPP